MESTQVRENLRELARTHGASYAALSRVLGRNAAYVQQFVSRGTPARLEESDRALLARFFGVSEAVLGGRQEADVVEVPQLQVEASAGPGRLVAGEQAIASYSFDARWLRQVARGKPEDLSMVSVAGDSMAPTLTDGDNVLVDVSDTRIRDGIYVLRRDDTLMVKRLALHPTGATLTIASDNPAYPTWSDVPVRSVAVIGRVAGIWRTLR